MSRPPAAEIRHGLLLTITMSVLTLQAPAAEAPSASPTHETPADEIVYRTEQGVTFQVTAEGLTRTR